MKRPLTALLIAPDAEVREAILDQRKCVTIREGHRDYREGDTVMICCHLDPWAVQADVVSVRHCTAEELTAHELTADGFTDTDDLITGMRRYYPNFGRTTPVTIIWWKNIRGKLAE